MVINLEEMVTRVSLDLALTRAREKRGRLKKSYGKITKNQKNVLGICLYRERIDSVCNCRFIYPEP